MPFETFTKRMTRPHGDPTVTIQRRGLLSMTPSAYAALGEPAFVELLFDRDTRVIGLRAVNDDSPHRHPVRRTGTNRSSIVVPGHAFTAHYGIPTDVTVRRPAHMHDGVLCVDLKDSGTEIVGNRRART